METIRNLKLPHTTGIDINKERYSRPPFTPRGPVSEQLLFALSRPMPFAHENLENWPQKIRTALTNSIDVAQDDDLQLALLILHGTHYGSIVDADEDWEWHPATIAARVEIERAFEQQLREQGATTPLPPPEAEAVATALFELTQPTPGPSLSRFIAKHANDEQVREYVISRSVYTLKEADPQTWSIPRLNGRAKAAMVEIQTDEYGGGRPERMHSAIFATAMRALGLNDQYGVYLDVVPALTIASFNMMSMFGLNRRLRGASAGHYAAYEMTSSIPNKLIADGFRRLGYGKVVTDYFDEHVEADAVHEQIAGRDLAGGLAEQEPDLVQDIIFGANASIMIDGQVSQRMLEDWEAGRSAQRQPSEPHQRDIAAHCDERGEIW